MRILVIDDDKDLLEVTEALLVSKGFEVATNCNWDKGWQLIESFKPQMILLDVFLNGIDGLDICKQIKSTSTTCDIPVLIFSSYPSIAERVIYEYGADDFIAKPFELNDLITKVHSVLAQRVTV